MEERFDSDAEVLGREAAMQHRMLRNAEGWEWHIITTGLADEALRGAAGHVPHEDVPPAAPGEGKSGNAAQTELTAVKRQLPECADWLDAAYDRNETQFTVTELPGGEEALHGTLLLRMSEDRRDVVPFHYWLTARRLVTLQRDLRFLLRLQREPWEDKLERAGTAPEAFTVMLRAALDPIQDGLDVFERGLCQLEEAMNGKDGSAPADLMNRKRHELLHWRLSYVGVQKTEGALSEAFAANLLDTEGHRKLTLRLKRVGTVIGHYAGEIDTWLALDEAMSSRRGHDGTKTLASIAILFAPAAAAGALWGMNFPELPWADEPWGFAALCGAVLIATAVLYLWLIRSRATADRPHGRGEHHMNSRRDRRKARRGSPHRAQQPLLPHGSAAELDREAKSLPSRSARHRS